MRSRWFDNRSDPMVLQTTENGVTPHDANFMALDYQSTGQ